MHENERMRKISDERLSRQAQDEEPVKPSTPAIRAALAVAKDYPVFPCDGVTKEPLVPRGFYAASQEPAQVAKWWRQYPEALIGVPTGSASGLLAIDCDPKSGDWYPKHRQELGSYRLHQTRRGKHLLYRYPGDVDSSRGSETIDVRGAKGYIIWWAAHGSLPVGEPGVCPAWLVELCKRLARPKVNGAHKLNGHDTQEGLRKFKDGERGDALSARAYYYHRMGLSTAEIENALLKYDLERCEPPYQITDGKAKVRYIARKKKHLPTDTQTNPVTARVLVRTMAQITEEGVDWLWKGFLARNKVHIIAGAGATMKSTLTLSMAATITRGGLWPDGTKCPRGNVLLWTGEDDLGDTVKPRFRWSGGDQERCTVLYGVDEDSTERAFDPARDIALLEKVCEEMGEVSLIIVDPIVVIVEKDNNSVNDVRRALLPLQRLAKKYHCVVLGIQHFNKGSKGKDPVERITGSGGWSQAPRIVLATAPIVDGEGKDPTRYVFTCIKTFAKKQKGGYEYGFEEEPKTEIARTAWGRYLDGTGLHIITEAEGNGDGESKLGAAKQFLSALLEKGSVSHWEVYKRAEEASIRGITLKRAKEELKVESIRVGKNAFRWKLPNEE